jgi:hypothetical protein
LIHPENTEQILGIALLEHNKALAPVKDSLGAPVSEQYHDL